MRASTRASSARPSRSMCSPRSRSVGSTRPSTGLRTVSAAELTFDPESHIYRHQGRIVPSVTQVLSILNDFSDVHPDYLEASRAFGQHVHAMIDLDNKAELDEEALDGELLPYLNQWRLFLRESKFEVTASELRVHNKALGYAGT